MITELSKAEYQDEMAMLLTREWKRLPKDETGAPILDRPLFSKERIGEAALMWVYLLFGGCHLGLFYMLRWHGRPYAQFKHKKAGRRYGKPEEGSRERA